MPAPTATITTTTNASYKSITISKYIIASANYNYYDNPQRQLQLLRQPTAALLTPTAIIMTNTNANYNYYDNPLQYYQRQLQLLQPTAALQTPTTTTTTTKCSMFNTSYNY